MRQIDENVHVILGDGCTMYKHPGTHSKKKKKQPQNNFLEKANTIGFINSFWNTNSRTKAKDSEETKTKSKNDERERVNENKQHVIS